MAEYGEGKGSVEDAVYYIVLKSYYLFFLRILTLHIHCISLVLCEIEKYSLNPPESNQFQILFSSKKFTMSAFNLLNFYFDVWS